MFNIKFIVIKSVLLFSYSPPSPALVSSFAPPFPPYFLTLTSYPSPFCHQSFSSLLHCSSLFLFTNAFPSLISWNPSLITPHHRLSHLVHKCVINNSLHIQKQLFMSFRLTSFQRVNRSNAKKPSLSRFPFQVRMVYPSLLWSNLSSMRSVMNTGNHLDS